MDAQRWQKIKTVFDAALEIEPSNRAKFLDETCLEDAELRTDVQKLIDSFEVAGSFIEEPAANEVASLIIESKDGLKSGQRFAHYEIIRQIGVGGMGEVYLARDEKLSRNVAIKILSEEFGRHESSLQRFKQEAQAASALNHPNILVIHEIGSSDSMNYIVSEFIEGETLRSLVGDSSAKISQMLDIVAQIAGALAAAHAERIIHRDIKPENIMVRPDGYVKVLDFGLAKLIGDDNALFGPDDGTKKQNQTAKGLIMGTINYMSPEQAKGEKVDESTDIFSLGVVMYEMVAGRTPFRGDSMSETFANLINAEPQPLSRYSSNVPAELERIVSKTLRKDRSERYQTIKDLLVDLKSLRENLAFDERLERSQPSNEEQATAFLEKTTGGIKNHTGDTKYSFAGKLRIRRYLPGAVAALLVLALTSLGFYFLYVKRSGPVTDGRKTLAVLPFVNLSQDANAEYLSDGVTESVINNLSQLSGLKVMSRNSAFRFKKDQTDIKSIGSQLGAETVVTGDIKTLGDKLIINVRLINAVDDSQIWGSQYVRTPADLIATQNEIAQAVAQNLRLQLTRSDQQALAKHYTDNSEAYQLYLRGRFHVFKLTPPEVETGISYFQQAIAIDPNYALAYAGLADAYRALAVGSEMPPIEFTSKSAAYSKKAIELDDSLSEGHSGLGMTTFWGQWNWSGAETQYKRALELNPNSSIAHLFYAHLLSNTGRHPEALAEAAIARELDPLFPFTGALEGQFLNHAGQTDEALARLQKTFELDPNFWMPHLFASSAYIEKGNYDQAVVEAELATKLGPSQTASIAFESYALAKLGRVDEARALLDGLLKLSAQRFVPPNHIALMYNGLGEKDNALAWLEKAFEQHDPKMAFLKVEPKWNNLRSEPRFVALMKKMNFE